MDNLVAIETLAPGVLVMLPYGHVQHMVVAYKTFQSVKHTRSTRKLYPTLGGNFQEQATTPLGAPVDLKALGYLHKHQPPYPIYSLRSGRFGFLRAGEQVHVDLPVDLEKHGRTITTQTRFGRPYLVISYPANFWLKGAAWRHLVDNPPDGLCRGPGVSRTDNPYRADHEHDVAYNWVAILRQSRYALLDYDD